MTGSVEVAKAGIHTSAVICQRTPLLWASKEAGTGVKRMGAHTVNTLAGGMPRFSRPEPRGPEERCEGYGRESPKENADH